MGSDNAHFATLILRWNGSRWARVPSPNLGTRTQLSAVAATSKSNLWAVGSFTDAGADQPFAVHCC